jgi:hypothetical protein
VTRRLLDRMLNQAAIGILRGISGIRAGVIGKVLDAREQVLSTLPGSTNSVFGIHMSSAKKRTVADCVQRLANSSTAALRIFYADTVFQTDGRLRLATRICSTGARRSRARAKTAAPPLPEVEELNGCPGVH